MPARAEAAAAGSLYWRFEEMLKRLETDSGSVMGADGSLFAIRRKLFRKPAPDIIDDMHTSLSILCDGYRVVRAEDVLAYERSVSSTGEEFRRKVRISCRAFNCHRLLWPRLSGLPALDLYKYVSHKFLRWISIYLQAACVLSLLAWFAVRGQGAQALLAMLAIGGIGWMLARTPRFAAVAKLWEFMTAFAATGLGVWKSLAGERYQTWTYGGDCAQVGLSMSCAAFAAFAAGGVGGRRGWGMTVAHGMRLQAHPAPGLAERCSASPDGDRPGARRCLVQVGLRLPARLRSSPLLRAWAPAAGPAVPDLPSSADGSATNIPHPRHPPPPLVAAELAKTQGKAARRRRDSA